MISHKWHKLQLQSPLIKKGENLHHSLKPSLLTKMLVRLKSLLRFHPVFFQ